MDNELKSNSCSRRRFLVGSVQALVCLAAGSLLYRLAVKDIFIANAVTKNLPYLKVSREDLMRYAADYRMNAVQGQKKVLAFTVLFVPLYRLLRLSSKLSAIEELEHQMAQTFLLSSDLFANGGDINKSVRYLRYYDPYIVVCSNPFRDPIQNASEQIASKS